MALSLVVALSSVCRNTTGDARATVDHKDTPTSFFHPSPLSNFTASLRLSGPPTFPGNTMYGTPSNLDCAHSLASRPERLEKVALTHVLVLPPGPFAPHHGS